MKDSPISISLPIYNHNSNSIEIQFASHIYILQVSIDNCAHYKMAMLSEHVQIFVAF